MTPALRAVVLCCLACAAIMAAAPTAAGSDPVNVAAASFRNASGTLRVGRDVVVGQPVQAAAGERVELLFADGSSLTLAPNAQATIEAFSFDSRQGSGHLAVRLSSGLFRFAGGRIARRSTAILDTPAAALAVRDGIVLVRAEPERTTAIATVSAEVTVSNRAGTHLLRRPGWQVIAEAASPPRPSTAAPASLLSTALAELDPGARSLGAVAGGGPTATPTAAVNALSDANTLLQKSPAGGAQPGVRGRGP